MAALINIKPLSQPEPPMHARTVLALIALAAASAPAFAFDDEMMGTMVNGRMPIRDERADRVQDPEMDREERAIDREKRQGRNTVDAAAEDGSRLREREPFQGRLPD